MAIDWRNEPVLDSVQLPGSETKYWVQDTEAREKIEALASATLFIGVSTTEITDGGTEKPTINEEEVNPGVGNIVIWKPLTGAPLEFIWDGSKWNLLGGQALDGLGDLAYKDSASGSYVPEGSVNLTPTLTSAVTSVDHNFNIVASFSVVQEEGYSYGDLALGTALSSISYFGSSQALNYINLASRNNVGSTYTGVVTDVKLDIGSTMTAITRFTSGRLPSISNQSTVTVAMGTGSSNTTLIFSLSDIGFNPGTTPALEYQEVLYPSSISLDVNYTDVSFSTLNPSTTDIVIGISDPVPLYYSVALTGSISTSTVDVLTDVSATFSGTTSTITVS